MPFALMDTASQQLPTLADALFECERRIILDTLIECENHRVRAAKALGLSRATLYRKLKAHGLIEQAATWRAILVQPKLQAYEARVSKRRKGAR